MFYLPRICEHCLNPSCVASCPSGAMYKRTEDGIVHSSTRTAPRLADVCVQVPIQEGVFQPPRPARPKKCTLCYPRGPGGVADGVLKTCVGGCAIWVWCSMTSIELAGRVGGSDTDLYEAQPDALDHDPRVIARARAEGTDGGSEGAAAVPVYALISTYRVALPLHPNCRTMPMVYQVRPAAIAIGRRGQPRLGTVGRTWAICSALDALRIPIAYLAELFTAGDTEVWSRGVLRRLAAMRCHARDINLGQGDPAPHPRSVGMTETEPTRCTDCVVAKYEALCHSDVVRGELPAAATDDMGCSLSVDGGPGMYEVRSVRAGQPSPVPIAVESFHARHAGSAATGGAGRSRVNLLNWDPNGAAAGALRTSAQQDVVQR